MKGLEDGVKLARAMGKAREHAGVDGPGLREVAWCLVGPKEWVFGPGLWGGAWSGHGLGLGLLTHQDTQMDIETLIVILHSDWHVSMIEALASRGQALCKAC